MKTREYAWDEDPITLEETIQQLTDTPPSERVLESHHRSDPDSEPGARDREQYVR
jgi:hypothetical protein